MREKMNHYVLNCSASEDINGRGVGSEEILNFRVGRNLWPLYRGTPLQTYIQPDDICLVYFSRGRRKFEISSAFMGYFRVEQRIDWNPRLGDIDAEDVLTNAPVAALRFESFDRFVVPVFIRPIVSKLEMVSKNPQRWWVFLQGGCRRLSKGDFETIRKESGSFVTK